MVLQLYNDYVRKFVFPNIEQAHDFIKSTTNYGFSTACNLTYKGNLDTYGLIVLKMDKMAFILWANNRLLIVKDHNCFIPKLNDSLSQNKLKYYRIISVQQGFTEETEIVVSLITFNAELKPQMRYFYSNGDLREFSELTDKFLNDGSVLWYAIDRTLRATKMMLYNNNTFHNFSTTSFTIKNVPKCQDIDHVDHYYTLDLRDHILLKLDYISLENVSWKLKSNDPFINYSMVKIVQSSWIYKSEHHMYSKSIINISLQTLQWNISSIRMRYKEALLSKKLNSFINKVTLEYTKIRDSYIGKINLVLSSDIIETSGCQKHQKHIQIQVGCPNRKFLVIRLYNKSTYSFDQYLKMHEQDIFIKFLIYHNRHILSQFRNYLNEEYDYLDSSKRKLQFTIYSKKKVVFPKFFILEDFSLVPYEGFVYIYEKTGSQDYMFTLTRHRAGCIRHVHYSNSNFMNGPMGYQSCFNIGRSGKREQLLDRYFPYVNSSNNNGLYFKSTGLFQMVAQSVELKNSLCNFTVEFNILVMPNVNEPMLMSPATIENAITLTLCSLLIIALVWLKMYKWDTKKRNFIINKYRQRAVLEDLFQSTN
ncbi:hypothetical protein GJ496_006154 [Pomphorhynchus laevis]|nr:hypothetical protein GJ496_006154 [Pomphorhynchus laevis]